MPDQMEMATLLMQIDPHLAVGQGAVSLWKFQVQRIHIDIDHDFRLVGLFQAFFSLLQTQMEIAIDVKMDLAYWGGLLLAAGFAPAFDRQGTHGETSDMDCWTL